MRVAVITLEDTQRPVYIVLEDKFISSCLRRFLFLRKKQTNKPEFLDKNAGHYSFQ